MYKRAQLYQRAWPILAYTQLQKLFCAGDDVAYWIQSLFFDHLGSYWLTHLAAMSVKFVSD
jgi:hypothetical protein